MVKFSPLSVSQIIESVSGTVLRGEGTKLEVVHLAEPVDADAQSVSFVISEKFVKDVERTNALVVVVQTALADKVLGLLPSTVRCCIASDNAYLGFAKLTERIARQNEFADWNFDSKLASHIHSSAEIDPTAKVSVGAVVCEGAKIGARTVLLPNVVVGPRVQIGADCTLFPGVVLYPNTTVGARVRIHANAVLGSDGFGYAPSPQGSVKIWHLGKVVVGSDVEIGAGTMIDRGTIKDTVIESGVKIDNLVQIGHNGFVKSHAILCAQVGMAGNVTIGKAAILAGKVGVADKLEIGDGALVGPMSGLSKDVAAGEQVMGQQPARARRVWWKQVALVEKLPELFDRVKTLERKGE